MDQQIVENPLSLGLNRFVFPAAELRVLQIENERGNIKIVPSLTDSLEVMMDNQSLITPSGSGQNPEVVKVRFTESLAGKFQLEVVYPAGNRHKGDFFLTEIHFNRCILKNIDLHGDTLNIGSMDVMSGGKGLGFTSNGDQTICGLTMSQLEEYLRTEGRALHLANLIVAVPERLFPLIMAQSDQNIIVLGIKANLFLTSERGDIEVIGGEGGTHAQAALKKIKFTHRRGPADLLAASAQNIKIKLFPSQTSTQISVHPDQTVLHIALDIKCEQDLTTVKQSSLWSVPLRSDF